MNYMWYIIYKCIKVEKMWKFCFAFLDEFNKAWYWPLWCVKVLILNKTNRNDLHSKILLFIPGYDFLIGTNKKQQSLDLITNTSRGNKQCPVYWGNSEISITQVSEVSLNQFHIVCSGIFQFTNFTQQPTPFHRFRTTT